MPFGPAEPCFGKIFAIGLSVNTIFRKHEYFL
jgi:hypothetical protein